MNTNRDIQAMDELRELSPFLANLSKQAPYSLPDSEWFIRNEAVIQNLVLQQMNEPDVVDLNKENPFQIPEQYFHRFADELATRIQREEAREELSVLSPLLSGISRNTLYEVPEAYHTGFRENLMKELEEKTSAPVISLLFRKKILQIAVAASVLIFLLVFGWKRQFKLQRTEEQVTKVMSEKEFQQLLAELDDQTIIQYLNQNDAGLMHEDPEYLLDGSTLPETEEYLDPDFSEQFFNELERNSNFSTRLN